MCGICGVLTNTSSPGVDGDRLEAMNRALVHRGPDDEGLWKTETVGFAMRRLSVIDVESGRQPMTNEDGSVVLIFNGEIYNFKELRDTLRKQGHTFLTESDTEVIVHGYEQWGDEVLDHLNGMFAFALYDQNRERLLMARDRLGVKPLYYTTHNGVFAFASELRALVCGRFVDGALNAAALDAYFTYLYIPAPDTIFQRVFKLRPGEKLVYEKGGYATETYWGVSFRPDESWTLDSAAEAYKSLLWESVRLQRVSDVPLGAFLSGGMDSSAVVAALCDVSDGPVKTFSIGFTDEAANELPYARAVADHFSTDHVEEILKPDMVELLPTLIPHFGEPFADSSVLPTWLVSSMARKSVTVALSGDGGDELFAGYTWTHMNRRVAEYRKIPPPLRRLMDGALGLLPPSPWIEKVRRFSGDSFLGPMESFRRRSTCFDEEGRSALYGPALSRSISSDFIDRFQEHADRSAHLSEDDRMLFQDISMYLPDDVLTKVDRMTMAHSLEARVPLLDHRLVEFAATVPFALKYEGGGSKRLVKRALAGILPPETLIQRKRGFSIPIDRWFREELGEHYRDAVLADGGRCGQILNKTALESTLDLHVKTKENWGHRLWAVLVLEHWLRDMESTHGIRVHF